MKSHLLLVGIAATSALAAACDPKPAAVSEGKGSPQTPAPETSSINDIKIPDPLNRRSAAGSAETQFRGALPSDEATLARSIMENPAAHKPETWVYVTKYLWERGDRQQAAFWHFLFQIRTLPWLEYDRQMGPFRSGVNASIGATINEWLGSDYDAWLETTRRAIAYERRLPLSHERPAGVSEAAWAQSIARGRQTWETDFRQLTGPGGTTRAQIEAVKRQNGRYVGPLRDPGAPLPNDWR